MTTATGAPKAGWTRSRRSELTMIGDVLAECRKKEGVGKTYLVYAIGMTSTQIDRYLDLLVGRGFLDREVAGQAKGPLLRLTENGRVLLEKIREIEKMLGGDSKRY